MKLDYDIIGYSRAYDGKYRRFLGSDNLDTTTMNQVFGLPGLYSTFTDSELLKLRIVDILASVISIVSCGVGIYLIISIDKRRKMFRHQLIFFLIIFDLLKAIVLCIYPIIVLIWSRLYGDSVFYNTLGWLTAFAVEGSDVAIFVFALHFGILIFKPNWKWLNRRTGNMEGGFYRLRALMYPLTLSIPAILASLAFIDFRTIDEAVIKANTNVVLDNNYYNFTFQAYLGGYKPLSEWCYLPPYPYWYQIALAWGPRIVIIIMIWAIYIGIYLFVSIESRKIKTEIHEFREVPVQIEHTTEGDGSFDGLLHFAKLFLRHAKTFFLIILRLLKSFFFFRIDEDEDFSERKRNKNSQRMLSNSLPDFHDDRPIISNQDISSIDDVDIEDGYNSDSNNCLQILSNGHEHNISKVKNSASSPSGKNRKEFKVSKPRRTTIKNKDPENQFSKTDHGNSLYLNTLKRVTSHTFTDNHLNTSKNFVIISKKHNTVSSNDVHNRKAFKSSRFKEKFWRHRSKSPDQASSTFDQNTNIGNEESSLYSTSDQFNAQSHLEEFADLNGHVERIKNGFQSEMYNDFKRRRDQIKRNIKSIFIYPIAYVILWIVPFFVYCLSFKYEILNGPVVGLHYVATFMRPLNGFVDVCVFVFRELPWRYSWACIQTKELMNRYRLKGEIGESEIMALCNSPLGRKGWYYRGRWAREECWKHKPQTWKRVCWYVHRSIKGLLKNSFDYSDRCLDRAYWNAYYTMRDPNVGPALSTKNGLCSMNNSLSSSFTDHTSEYYKDVIKIPIFWRLLHKFPLQEGIDLDELDRHIREKYRNDDFVLPGLALILANNNENSSSFKPYFQFDTAKDKSSFEDLSGSRKEERSLCDEQISSRDGEKRKIMNMDFVDVCIGNSSEGANDSGSNYDKRVDLLSFLKSSP